MGMEYRKYALVDNCNLQDRIFEFLCTRDQTIKRLKLKKEMLQDVANWD